MYFFTLVVGYFAYAQYDIVIAREQRDRNPHEKVRILFQRFSALTLDFGEKSEYNNVL